MIMNMLTEVRRRTHKQSKTFSIDKIPGIIELENTISELKTSTDVMPDVRNPERAGREKASKTMQLAKREVYC